MDYINKAIRAARNGTDFYHKSLSFVADFDGKGGYFKSYATKIAELKGGEVSWVTERRYSATTSKHLREIKSAFIYYPQETLVLQALGGENGKV